MAVLNTECCSIDNQCKLFSAGIMCENLFVGDNPSKAVLNTLELPNIETRETPEQGITVVKPAASQSICSQNSCVSSKILSKTSEISDLEKTYLTDTTNVLGKGKI